MPLAPMLFRLTSSHLVEVVDKSVSFLNLMTTIIIP